MPAAAAPTRTWPFWLVATATVVLAFVWTGISLALSSAAPADYQHFNQNPRTLLLRIAVPMALTGLIVVALLAWRRPGPGLLRELPDIAPAPVWMKIIAGLAFGAAAVLAVLRVLRFEGSALPLAAAIVVAVCCVAFTEELVFRGWVVTAARRALSSEAAVAGVSALLFGIWHLPNIIIGADVPALAIQFVATTVFGLVFYCVRRVTGHLGWAMLLHAVWDFAQL